MWMRTEFGTQFYSYSSDRGRTWSEAAPSMVVSPCAPMSIKHLPATGDLVAVYNDSSTRYAFVRHDPRNNPTWIGERTPLIAAISSDEGKTWHNHTVLEDDPEGRFCYTSILFIQRKVILSYTAEKQKNATRSGWGNMRVTLFDHRYLYK
jgi:sialidase-1